MRFHFVVNPHGRRGRAVKIWQRVEKIVQQKNLDYALHFPTQSYLVSDIVRDITDVNDRDDNVYLIVVGGDGTLNVVVNSIVNRAKTFVGLIPAGSGNDFARSRGMASNFEELIDRILDTDHVTDLDLGCATFTSCYDDRGQAMDIDDKKRYFNNAVGIGFDADVCVRVQHSSLAEKLALVHLSKLAYACAALPLFFEHRNFEATISVGQEDNSLTFSHVLFAALMNEPYEGGGFKFCPDAQPDDGIIDACIAHDIQSKSLIHLLPRAMWGKHTHARGISMMSGHTYRVRTGRPVWVQTDGEVEYRCDDIIVSVVPKALHFLGL